MTERLSPARAAQRRKRVAEWRIGLCSEALARDGFTDRNVARFHRAIRKHDAAMQALARACRVR